MISGMLVALCLALAASDGTGGEAPPSVQELIDRAGSTEDEQVRYAALKALATHPDASTELKAELKGLLFVADWWANGRKKWLAGKRWPGYNPRRAAESGYLCGWFVGRAKPGNNYPGKVKKSSPLYPLWCFQRARLLIAMPIQMGMLLRSKRFRDSYYGEARRLLEVAGEAFPKNRLIGMYLGAPIPWAALAADPKAPAWANLQREGLTKLAEIVRWWIDNRQVPDGQYGGGWGDDCEMWRWWSPVLLGFEDPKIVAAQERLSSSLMSQPHMKHGYTSHMSDVEHTGEDSADSITPMMFLKPDDPAWAKRAIRLASLMRDKWTGRNTRGGLMFRSTYFTADRVDGSAKRACDTVYHPRAVQPALLLWQRTGDKTLGKLFTAWMDTWVDATARAERGKPAGIIASAIHWPDGKIGGIGKDWWRPENYGTALYDWPSAMVLMQDSLLLAWHMTGEEKYLAPLRSMAKHRREYLARPQEERPAPGSTAWCAEKMGAGFLSSSLSKVRLLTGNKEFDEVLKADADGYVKYRMTGDRKALEHDLAKTAAALRRNLPAFTSEVRWTDRVLAFTRNYARFFPNAPAQVGWQLLLGSSTGAAGAPFVFPTLAVRWLTPPDDIAALVTDSTGKRFAAELYHFGPKPRPITAELFLLKLGKYQMELRADGKELAPAKTIDVTGPRTRVTFELPSRRLAVLTIEKTADRDVKTGRKEKPMPDIEPLDIGQLKAAVVKKLERRRFAKGPGCYADTRGGEETLYGLTGAANIYAALGLPLGDCSARHAWAQRILAHRKKDGSFDGGHGPGHALHMVLGALNILGEPIPEDLAPLAPTDPAKLPDWLDRHDWTSTHKEFCGQTIPLLAGGRISEKWRDVLAKEVGGRLNPDRPLKTWCHAGEKPWRVISSMYHVLSAFDVGRMPYPQPELLLRRLLALRWEDVNDDIRRTVCTDGDWALLLLHLRDQLPEQSERTMAAIRKVSARRIAAWRQSREAVLNDTTHNIYCYLWVTAVFQSCIRDHYRGAPIKDTLNAPELFRL